MAAGATYQTIATQTLVSDQGSIDFTAISGSFTDITAVISVKGSAANHLYCRVGNNSYDSGSNYSCTGMFGRLANAGPSSETFSERNTNVPNFRITPFTYVSNNHFSSIQVDFMHYSGTSNNKTVLSRASTVGSHAYSGTEVSVQLWRSTSAINQISFFMNAGNIAAGSTITLYGITAA